jgi:hypothetical protein
MLDLFDDCRSPICLEFSNFMTPPSDTEKRQSFRWPVPGPRQDAELRFGANRVKVHLLDESAGGFSALCDQAIGIEAGAKGLLNVGEDWFDVSVANVTPIDPPPFDDDDGKPLTQEFLQPVATQTPAEPDESKSIISATPVRYRLGLSRLGDAFDPEFKSSYYSLAGLTCHLKHVGSGTMGIVIVGLMLAAAVVIVPFASIEMISSETTDAEVKNATRWLDHNSKSVSKIADENRPVARAADAVRSTPSREPTAFSPISDKLGELRRSIQRMPGAMPFVLPDVVKQLQLTPSQQKRIEELVDAAVEMIKNLGSATGNSANRTRSKEILDSTRHKVLELLDDDQKKKWSELTGESAKDEKNDKK